VLVAYFYFLILGYDATASSKSHNIFRRCYVYIKRPWNSKILTSTAARQRLSL